MALVASTIPNLVSGVSQQPSATRLRTSGSEMINGFPSIVSGLLKRPPSEFVARLPTGLTVSDGAAVHMIDRDVNEKLILIVGDDGLELYDQNGVQQTVNIVDNADDYLPTSNAGEKMRFVTVADTTFCLNTEAVVATEYLLESSVSLPGGIIVEAEKLDPDEHASVFVKQAVANVAYAVYLDGVLIASFTTSDNTTASTSLEGTSEIAEGLRADAVTRGLVTNPAAYGSTFTFERNGEEVVVDDQFGGSAMTAYGSSLQEFSDLPPREQNGRTVKIEGNLDEQGTSYWVVYQNGVWRETAEVGRNQQLVASTMPQKLRKVSDGVFNLEPVTWTPRNVGDDTSNPPPSFAGRTINNMFLFKGRLGFLSEENVVMSAVTALEDLYLSTVIQLVATDPIDIASATGRVSNLYHATAFSDELILFSDKQQFRLSSGNILSAETVGITNSTSYPCSIRVPPTAVGSSAYFVADGPTHTVARELFIDGSRETVSGEDIAVQIPSYIPKNIRALTSSTASDVFLALSEDEPNALYVYKWYTSERRKIQSAWCKWVFDPNVVIVGMGFLDSYLYLVYKVGGEVLIDRINVSPIIDKDLLLDHQLVANSAMTYDAMADLTTFDLGYDHPGTFEFYRSGDGSLAPLVDTSTVTKVSDAIYTFTGDVTGDEITAGINYEFLYEFSTQYLREENSDGESAIQDGRLQLRYFSVIYTDTSYFEAHVTPTNSDTKITTFNGRTLADPENIADVIPRDTGEFKFPIFAQNEEVVVQLKSDQPYRCAFGSVEWTANYRQIARRV